MDGIQSENVREIETVDLLTDSAAELDPNAAVDAAVTDEKAATASQSDAVNKAVNSSEAAADGKDVAAVRNNELPSNTNEQSLEAVPSENGTKVGTSAHPTQPATEEELDVMCRQGGSECSSCQSQNVLVSFKSSNKASCRFDPATAICALSTDGASSFECGAVKGLIKALDDGTTSSFVFNGLIAVAFLAGAFFFRRRILKLYGGGGKYSSLTSGEQREEDADELFSGAMSGTRAGLSNGSGMHGVAQLRNSSLKNASEIIPLSSAADEEWGWEDGGSKVEMSSFSSTGMNGSSSTYSRDAARKAEEDLQLALALSVSRSQPQSRSSSVASKQSNSEVGLPPSNSRLSTNGISSANRTSVTAPSPPPEPSFPHMPKTSSKPTSAPPVVVPKKPLPRKRDDDDIFATMGLVAKPTFSAANGRTSPSTNIAKNESSGDASRNVATKSTVPAVQKRSVTPPVPMVGTQDIVLANKSQKGNATAPTANIGVGNGNKANVTDVESKEEDDLLAAEIAQELGNSNDTNASWGEDDDLDDLLND